MTERRTARVAAQAKLNLHLRVLAREQSGFHTLETIFHRIELADAVTVHVGVKGRALDCAGPALPADGLGPVERNLAWRAAAAYADAAGWPQGFAIEIDKRIPVGGGLGGGSADAGAVLRALDALAEEPLPDGALLDIAAALGADVPFVTQEAPMALAWGRGERMLALPALPQRAVLLATFDEGVATADAYHWLSESRSGEAIAGRPAPEPAAFTLDDLTSWRGVAAAAFNDFEDAVGRRRPLVAATLAELRSVDEPPFELVLMTGSGATVFGVLPEGSWRQGETTSSDRGVRELLTRTAARVEEILVSE